MNTALELIKQLWPIALILFVGVIALILPDKKEKNKNNVNNYVGKN